MIDRRLWDHLNGRLLGFVAALMMIGIVNLYSATIGPAYEGVFSFYQRQLCWFLIAAILGLAVCWIDYRYYEQYAYVLFAIIIIVIAVVLVHGMVLGGVKRWIRLGTFAFQPSEVMKIALILALGRYFSHFEREEYRLRDLWTPGILIVLPTLLVARQPDLGTAFILLLIFFSILMFVRVRIQSFWILLATIVLTAPLLWMVLKDYQRTRILTFLDPGRDPLGAGYHVIQSKIALGSGGVWGKGFLHGTQCKLQFLPEHHTDFAFAVLGEEWGFVGCGIVLGLYLAIIVVGLGISARAKDRYGAIVAFGVTAMIFWHVTVNIGMVVGIMPVVGLPLPFLSYGGSSALTNAIAIGLLLNVEARRHIF